MNPLLHPPDVEVDLKQLVGRATVHHQLGGRGGGHERKKLLTRAGGSHIVLGMLDPGGNRNSAERFNDYRTMPNREIMITAAAMDSHAPASVASVRSLRRELQDLRF